jgi:hypothetical protein
MASEHLPDLRGVLPYKDLLTADDEPDNVTENPTETLLPAVADHPLAEIEDRVFVGIRPSETAVDPQAAIHAMEHLQQLLREHQQTGLRDKVAGTTQRPMVEWLIVSTGGADPSLRYLVGSNYVDLIPDLKGLCRQCFPDTYEFERVEWHPRRLQTHVDPEQTAAAGVHPDLDEPRAHPAITATHPYVAGVQWYGDPDRRADWQTGLTRFDEMLGTGDGRRRRDRPREQRHESQQVPLATLVDTLSESPLPAVFSVVCRPYEDWSDRQDRYVTNLREGLVSTMDHLWEFVAPRDQEERDRYEPPPSDQERIDRITARDPRRSLCLAVRAAVLTRSALGAAKSSSIGSRTYTSSVSIQTGGWSAT